MKCEIKYKQGVWRCEIKQKQSVWRCDKIKKTRSMMTCDNF